MDPLGKLEQALIQDLGCSTILEPLRYQGVLERLLELGAFELADVDVHEVVQVGCSPVVRARSSKKSVLFIYFKTEIHTVWAPNFCT